MSQFKPAGKMQVDTFELDWHIVHFAQATTTSQNSNGICVSVSLADAKAKELVIDFPVIAYNYDRPKNNTDFEKRLLTCVKRALELGWNPEKRGKPFRMSADA